MSITTNPLGLPWEPRLFDEGFRVERSYEVILYPWATTEEAREAATFACDYANEHPTEAVYLKCETSRIQAYPHMDTGGASGITSDDLIHLLAVIFLGTMHGTAVVPGFIEDNFSM